MRWRILDAPSRYTRHRFAGTASIDRPAFGIQWGEMITDARALQAFGKRALTRERDAETSRVSGHSLSR